MTSRGRYVPGSAAGAQVRKEGDKWTLVLVRDLRHPPAMVWQALTDPAHLREWAPFDADGELEPLGSGTRLTLWHNIDRGFISWGAAGWHICFDVLERLLAGQPIGRIVGPDAIKFGGWQRLNVEYAKQFGMEPPDWPPAAPKP